MGNNQLDRQVAVSILMNSGASATEALKMARLQQQQQQQAQQAQQPFDPSLQQQVSQQQALMGQLTATDMLRLQRDFLNREIAARAGLPSFAAGGAETLPFHFRAAGVPQHPSFAPSSLLGQPMGLPPAVLGGGLPVAPARHSPPLSPSLKASSSPDIPTEQTSNAMAVALESLQRAADLKRAANHRDSLSSHGSSTGDSSSNKKARTSGPAAMHIRAAAAVLPRRGSKAKLRDDFWGKVGKNNSHIHLVNIVLGRLLQEHVQQHKGNRVLSNDLIQQILEHKLYGKYAVKDFFATANKASETVRNTWTRLNFASDNIRKGLSRYKEQTWQAIERCGFEDAPEADLEEMEQALKVFAATGRFVAALDVALKGIITEPFMGVLMQLRIEWNGLCLNCRPGDHDTVVGGFLRKYGLYGK